jgi:hypothetical protein
VIERATMNRLRAALVDTLPVAVLLVALVVASFSVAGCASDPSAGYSMQSTFPENVRSVAVPIFENPTLHRNVEYDITDALIKEIEARTPYKVTSTAEADTVLLGRIRSVELNQLSKSRLTGLSEEVILTVTIDFEWTDLRSDAVLVERERYAGTALFVPSTPTGEAKELGEMGAAQALARSIVGEMRSSW